MFDDGMSSDHVFDDDSDRDWAILYEPPSPGWDPGSRSGVLLDGGQWQDLEFLRPYKDSIKQLMITAEIADISGVKNLHALERLVLLPYNQQHGTVDLGSLPQLRDLYVVGSVPIEVTVGHRLRQLQVEQLQAKLGTALADLTHLEVLRLAAPRKVPATYPESLRHLNIAQVRRWDDNVGVLQGLSSLRELCLNDIRGMRDLRSFAEVSALKRLYLDDCEELTSIEGPRLAPEAQYLFVGRTPLRGTMHARWTIPE